MLYPFFESFTLVSFAIMSVILKKNYYTTAQEIGKAFYANWKKFSTDVTSGSCHFVHLFFPHSTCMNISIFHINFERNSIWGTIRFFSVYRVLVHCFWVKRETQFKLIGTNKKINFSIQSMDSTITLVVGDRHFFLNRYLLSTLSLV